jgi:hypothetical protein
MLAKANASATTATWALWPDSSGGFPDCPFPPSRTLRVLRYNNGLPTGPKVDGTGCDTFYPTWSAGGDLFTTWTDGGVNMTSASGAVTHLQASSCGPCQKNNGSGPLTQGFATVSGSSPATLRLSSGGVYTESSALPYQGRYPSGSLYYRGAWYYGTYTLAELWGSAQYPCSNWCVQGPFVGFRHSTDGGATWHEPRKRMADDFASYRPGDNLFGERGPICHGSINNTVPAPSDPCNQFLGPSDCSPFTCVGKWVGKVKFGAAHVVDLGRELEYSPETRAGGGEPPRAYVVGHGASHEYQPHSWMQVRDHG